MQCKIDEWKADCYPTCSAVRTASLPLGSLGRFVVALCVNNAFLRSTNESSGIGAAAVVGRGVVVDVALSLWSSASFAASAFRAISRALDSLSLAALASASVFELIASSTSKNERQKCYKMDKTKEAC